MVLRSGSQKTSAVHLSQPQLLILKQRGGGEGGEVKTDEESGGTCRMHKTHPLPSTATTFTARKGRCRRLCPRPSHNSQLSFACYPLMDASVRAPLFGPNINYKPQSLTGAMFWPSAGRSGQGGGHDLRGAGQCFEAPSPLAKTMLALRQCTVRHNPGPSLAP